MVKENEKLTFLGTIISIENSPIVNSDLNWIITVNVEKVISGSFSGNTFQFRVHSPARSALEIGRQYRMEFVLTQNGYIAD